MPPNSAATVSAIAFTEASSETSARTNITLPFAESASAAQAGTALNVSGFPSQFGGPGNKRFILALMGPAQSAQARGASAALNQYVEGANAATAASPRVYAYQVFDADGNFLDMWPLRSPHWPASQTTLVTNHFIDQDGFIWAGDAFTNRVLKFDLDGNFLYSWGAPGPQAGRSARSPRSAGRSPGPARGR